MKKLLLLVFLGTIIYAQQLRLTNDTLSVKNSFSNNQFLVKDSKSKLHFVYTSQSNQSNRSKDIIYAEEIADSFNVINITDDNEEDNYPSLSLDKDGNAHIVFLCRDTLNVFQIKYTNNIRRNFSSPVFLTDDNVNKANPVSIISPDSILHIVYFTFSYQKNEISYIAYNLKDFTVTKPIVLNEGETKGGNEASFALDKKGKLYLVLKSGPASGGNLKCFTISKGKLREVLLDVEEQVVHPKVVVDRFNTVNIVYKSTVDNRLYIINNISGYFGEPVAVTPENQNPVGFNNFAVDDVGRFYFVYQASDSSEERKDVSFYLVHGSIKKFSDPIKIKDLPNTEFIGNQASISACGNGQISILISHVDIRDFKAVSDLILKRGQIFGNPMIEVQSENLTFPETAVGDTSYIKLDFHNSGSALLKVYPAKLYNRHFNITLSDTIYIKPDSVKPVWVSFTPTDSTTFDASVKYFSNAVNSKSVNISLTGKGVYLPKLSTPKDTLFLVDENGFSDSLVFMNDGFVPLKIDSIKSSKNFPLTVSIDSVTINSNESIVVFFELSSSFTEFDEYFSDSIFVYSNDPKNPVKKFIVQGKQYEIITGNREKQYNDQYQLNQNFPNPFNPATTISFTINSTAYVKLGVFDALARQIAKLVDETLPAGTHNVTFNGENLSTGVYYYKLQVKNQEKSQPDFIDVKKMILVK